MRNLESNRVERAESLYALRLTAPLTVSPLRVESHNGHGAVCSRDAKLA